MKLKRDNPEQTVDKKGKCCQLYISTPELGGMNYYKKIIDALACYFSRNGWEKLFLTGGCYWLANMLHRGINESVFMINRMEEHCALYFENGLYDVRGQISMKNFHIASEREISFMKKNYIPKFATEELEQYLAALI